MELVYPCYCKRCGKPTRELPSVADWNVKYMNAIYCICDECQEKENQSMSSFGELRGTIYGPFVNKCDVPQDATDNVREQIKAEVKEMLEQNPDVKDQVESALDIINTPPHYNHSSFQPIDVIEDWGLSYSLGNTVKYICRHKHKGKPLEDLRKARWYLDREISRLEEQECKLKTS